MIPVKFKRFRREFQGREFTLLDVGCGNHSPSVTKRFFPECRYYGLDRGVYNNDASDLASMETFYEKDLETDDLADLPDGFFDVILFVHVIEHPPEVPAGELRILGRFARDVRIAEYSPQSGNVTLGVVVIIGPVGHEDAADGRVKTAGISPLRAVTATT